MAQIGRGRNGLTIGLIGLALLSVGCQSALTAQSTNLPNSNFMSLWHTYNDCKVASDLVQASSGLETLSAATQAQEASNRGFVLPLPSPLEQFVASQPNRLAVDVRAMTASCSLHTGQLALHHGRIDMARNAFYTVLTLEEEVSPYYAMQAKKFLAELEQGIDLALHTP